MRYLLTGALLFTLFFSCSQPSSNSAEAQPSPPTDTQRRAAQAMRGDMPQPERVRRWLQYNSPGAPHGRMEAFVGDWDTSWTVWDEPGAEPTVARGRASFRWAHDRRFVRGEFEGDVVGHRYDAQLVLGYDSFRENYVAIWTNSLETAPLTYRGRARVAANNRLAALELRGKADDCVHGRFDLDYRAVFEMRPDGTIRETIFGPDRQGREVRTAEIVYTRRRA
jgi:Protein of unknown function (DUF1579)